MRPKMRILRKQLVVETQIAAAGHDKRLVVAETPLPRLESLVGSIHALSIYCVYSQFLPQQSKRLLF